MTVMRYLSGCLLIALVVGGAGGVGLYVRRRAFPTWRGSTARLAEIVIGLAVVVLQSELLGLVHLFRPIPLGVTGALLLGGAIIAVRRLPAGPEEEREPRPGRWGTLVALGASALVVTQWIVQIIPAAQRGMFEVDTLDYHMPIALHWMQTGVIGPVNQTVPGLPVGYYPANAEIVHALGLVAWRTDALSLAVNVGWLLLGLLAAWVFGRRYGAGPLALTGAAVVFAVPILARNQPGSAMTDVPSMALLLAAVALLDLRDPAMRYRALALSGLAAGLSAGTKLTVVPMLVLLTVLIPFAVPVARRRAFGLWCAGLAVGGGFWYLRNLVVLGNPMPANRLPFGLVGMPVPAFRQFDTANQSVLHYATDGPVLRIFAHDLKITMGPLWIAVIAISVAALLGMLAGWRTARFPADRVPAMIGLTGLFGFAAYLVTPTTAGGPEGNPLLFAVDVRYALPMVALGLVGSAAVLRDREPIASAATVLLGGLTVVTVAARWHIPGADTQRRTDTAAGALLLLAVLLLIGAILRIRAGRGLPIRRTALVAAVTGAVVVLPAGGAFADYAHGHRYRSATDGQAAVWRFFQGLSGQRVATTGFALTYPLSGASLGSRVHYLGPVVSGALDDYTRCAAWTRALAAGRYGWVVTGPLVPGDQREPTAATWARANPALRQMMVAGSVRVFRVTAVPDPATCA